MAAEKLYALRTDDGIHTGYASVLFTAGGPVVWNDKTPQAFDRAIIYRGGELAAVQKELKREKIVAKPIPVRQWSSIREKFIRVE